MLDYKITTLIVENPGQKCPRLKSFLEKTPEFLFIGLAQSGKQAFLLINNYAPQLIFVQDELVDYSGIEFVKLLYQRNIRPEVVFIAGNENLAYEALEVEPLDYLMKPISKNDIAEMLQRLRFRLKRRELKRKMDVYSRSQNAVMKRIFTQKRGIIVLFLSEIVYCKAELTSTMLMLTSGEKVQIKTNLNHTLEIINDESFYKIGRSYCINRRYLRKIDKKNAKCLMLFDGNSWEIPVSRSVIKQLESLYTNPIY